MLQKKALKMSILELKLAERRNGIRYLDFVVDGQSLYELIGSCFDTVSCLALWSSAEERMKVLKRLLLREEADFLNNRIALYVCGECGGLDCGAVSLVIEEQEQTMVWREFGYENGWEEGVEFFEEIGPFMFSKQQYQETLEQARVTLQDTN
jgi:hypothetical protein